MSSIDYAAQYIYCASYNISMTPGPGAPKNGLRKRFSDLLGRVVTCPAAATCRKLPIFSSKSTSIANLLAKKTKYVDLVKVCSI